VLLVRQRLGPTCASEPALLTLCQEPRAPVLSLCVLMAPARERPGSVSWQRRTRPLWAKAARKRLASSAFTSSGRGPIPSRRSLRHLPSAPEGAQGALSPDVGCEGSRERTQGGPTHSGLGPSASDTRPANGVDMQLAPAATTSILQDSRTRKRLTRSRPVPSLASALSRWRRAPRTQRSVAGRFRPRLLALGVGCTDSRWASRHSCTMCCRRSAHLRVRPPLLAAPAGAPSRVIV
jgi:hypothetical protein